MSNDPENPASLSIENVAFVDEDQSKRRKNKQVHRRERTASDEIVRFAPAPYAYDGEDEMNPLLGRNSPNRAYPPAPAYQMAFPPGQYYGYSGQVPQQPPPGYPMHQMTSPQNIQYYDHMTGQVFMAPPPPQPAMMRPQSPSMHSPAASRQKRSPQARGGTTPPQMSNHKRHPEASPDAADHPLKRAPHVAPYVEKGQEEYEINIMTGQRSPLLHTGPPGYGSVTTPPRKGRSADAKPPSRRKSDPSLHKEKEKTLSPARRPAHRRQSSAEKSTGQHRRSWSDRLVLPPVDQELEHRRTSSGHLSEPPRHRRSSSDRLLPPKDPSPRKRLFESSRPRSSSAGGKIKPPPMHRRGSSLSEVSVGTTTSHVSVGTSASHVSIVSDISKSALYGGKTKSGKVQLHFPFENVRLSMDKYLPKGILYKRYIDDEEFEDYHLNDELNGPWEIDQDLLCHCDCRNCRACTERQQMLSENSYVLTVEDDIYRRVLDEISASQEMPCGLFFCGHHEDVSQPSILIAVVIVSVFLVAMILATYMTNA